MKMLHQANYKCITISGAHGGATTHDNDLEMEDHTRTAR